ncbi:hypothetical protein P4S63_25355 [Pseudoalteromonas sp. B193]
MLTHKKLEDTLYFGTIAKDPQNTKEFTIALYSCIIPTSKSLDNTHYTRLISSERDLGRYTKDNILFPHTELVENANYHNPDMYVFVAISTMKHTQLVMVVTLKMRN